MRRRRLLLDAMCLVCDNGMEDLVHVFAIALSQKKFGSYWGSIMCFLIILRTGLNGLLRPLVDYHEARLGFLLYYMEPLERAE